MIESDNENNFNNSKEKPKKASLYQINLITKQLNEMTIEIKSEKSKLNIFCYYSKDYFKISFQKSFSLEDLKKLSNYFLQFTEINNIFNEINLNSKKGQECLEGNENIDESIKLIIPLPSQSYPQLEFQLNKVKKQKDEIFKEYKSILDIYKHKIKIDNFNSIILVSKEKEKEIIKTWISPTKYLKAELLFSFHVTCSQKKESFYAGGHYLINNFVNYDIEKIGSVKSFHSKCDNKKSILIICKSQNEIFGGYTPLCFKNDDTYGKDNESFLFSLNRNQKYTKNSFDNNESIWCYEDYGPSFHWDLYFRKNKINTVKFEKKNYLTCKNWVDESKCYKDEFGIILDSLEIFQIKISDKPEEEEEEDNNISNISNINNKNNINNNSEINNINNNSEINTSSNNIEN